VIGALDGDWSEFSEAEQAAFAFTRRLAYQPHAVNSADLDSLRNYYKDQQILEIVFTVAGFSAMNRWTETLAIPAEASGSGLMRNGGKAKTEYPTFLRPTSDKFKDKVSKVAPLGGRESSRHGVCTPVAAGRPEWESRTRVEEMLAACRKRTPRLPLAGEIEARAILPGDWSKEPLPQWVRLLANFPKAGKARIVTLHAAKDKGKLDPKLKSQIAWIAARHDRAWYAVGHAQRRLKSLGLSDDDIFKLDGAWDDYSPGERTAFSLTRKATVAPASIEDDDVAELRKNYSDHQVAEIVYHITLAAFFDRVTEASGLQLEER
jgi:alkylhydroperoxidase family enzyme